MPGSAHVLRADAGHLPLRPGFIAVPAVDLAILLAALEDLQLDSLTPREEGAIENLRDALLDR